LQKENNMKQKIVRKLLLAALAAPILTGCSTVKVTESKTFTPTLAPLPATIYVADFEAGVITNEVPSAATTNRLSVVGDSLVYGSPGSVWPAQLQAKLADLMARYIVKNLTNAGYQAVRISPETPLPSEGWLVRGSFTGFESGNLPLRAMIGLGAGREDVQVACVIDRLCETTTEPLYEIHTDARTRKLPGSVFTPDPVAMVGRFALDWNDVEKDVKKTAAQIATQIGQQIRGQQPKAGTSLARR